jgi:hypothetical protein
MQVPRQGLEKGDRWSSNDERDHVIRGASARLGGQKQHVLHPQGLFQGLLNGHESGIPPLVAIARVHALAASDLRRCRCARSI